MIAHIVNIFVPEGHPRWLWVEGGGLAVAFITRI